MKKIVMTFLFMSPFIWAQKSAEPCKKIGNPVGMYNVSKMVLSHIAGISLRISAGPIQSIEIKKGSEENRYNFIFDGGGTLHGKIENVDKKCHLIDISDNATYEFTSRVAGKYYLKRILSAQDEEFLFEPITK